MGAGRSQFSLLVHQTLVVHAHCPPLHPYAFIASGCDSTNHQVLAIHRLLVVCSVRRVMRVCCSLLPTTHLCNHATTTTSSVLCIDKKKSFQHMHFCVVKRWNSFFIAPSVGVFARGSLFFSFCLSAPCNNKMFYYAHIVLRNRSVLYGHSYS